MALIPCPECKQQVSDRAAVCPRCGLALSATVAAPAASAAVAPAGVNMAPGPWTNLAVSPEEEVVWEGGASPRLLVRELPSALWALIAPGVIIAMLPRALQTIAGLRRELRLAIAEQRQLIVMVVVGAAVVLSLVRLARVLLRYLRLRTTRYRLTNQRLTVESGLLARRVDDVDLRMVQDVALEQSPLERLLGVGRLNIVSSDHTRPRLELMGIREPREVRERVRASAYQASQRQLYTRAT